MQLSFAGTYAPSEQCHSEVLEQHIVKIIHYLAHVEQTDPNVLETRVQVLGQGSASERQIEIEVTVDTDNMENGVRAADGYIKEAVSKAGNKISGTGEECGAKYLKRVNTEAEILSG